MNQPNPSPVTPPAIDHAQDIANAPASGTSSATFASAFGESGKRMTVAGREIIVRYLDVNDLIEIEQRVGSVDGIDQTNFAHLRFLLWLILRKGDPALTEDELIAGRYYLTEREAGRTLTLKSMRSAAMVAFMREVMIGSGMIDDPNDPESDDPNATAAASA